MLWDYAHIYEQITMNSKGGDESDCLEIDLLKLGFEVRLSGSFFYEITITCHEFQCWNSPNRRIS